MATCTAIYIENDGSRTAYFRKGDSFATVSTSGLASFWKKGAPARFDNNTGIILTARHAAIGDTNAYIGALIDALA